MLKPIIEFCVNKNVEVSSRINCMIKILKINLLIKKNVIILLRYDCRVDLEQWVVKLT